eukprot:4505884-Amphidinium_carterae.1
MLTKWLPIERPPLVRSSTRPRASPLRPPNVEHCQRGCPVVPGERSPTVGTEFPHLQHRARESPTDLTAHRRNVITVGKL